MRQPPFEQSPADVDSAAVPEGSSEDMMMDEAQSAPPMEGPRGGKGVKASAQSRYGNGRYGKSGGGIHAHHGPSHGGKKRV